MDFKQIMSLATQNKSQAQNPCEVKKVTTRSGGGKLNDSGVSQAAVQAFLAKRQHEMKQKAAEEEAAKRARIQERLAQSLGAKKKSGEKDTSVRGIKDERDQEVASSSQKRSSKMTGAKSGEKGEDRIRDRRPAPEKKSSKSLEQSTSKRHEVNGQKSTQDTSSSNRKATSETVKKASKNQRGAAAKKGNPMNIKELLAIAEKNRNGGSGSSQREMRTHCEASKFSMSKERGSGSLMKQDGKQERSRSERAQKESKFTNGKKDKSLKDGNTSGKDFKRSSQSTGVSRVQGMPAKSSPAKSFPAKSSPAKSTSAKSSPAKPFPAKSFPAEISSKGAGKTGKPTDSRHGNHGRPVSSKQGHVGQQRDREMLKRRRDSYSNEMDDFIDDEEGDSVDVSRYIKEIFGYDRGRYADDDDDLSNMESNYSQIEREEFKSTKIARLEDEIEQLKELAELKEQKQKLKKRVKK